MKAEEEEEEEEEMLMMIPYVLLVFLFVVGLIGTGIFLKFPTNNKFTALVQALSLQNTTTSNKQVQTPSNIVITKAEKSSAMKSSNTSGQFKAELRSVFATFDKNNDGHITQQELKESLKNIGITMSDKDVKEMVEKVDSNGDGLIDLDEFCELFESMMMSTREEAMNEEDENRKEKEEDGGSGYLKEAFDVFDGDGDGTITVEELGLVLSSLGFKEGKLLENCKEMIRKVDMDGDGKINFDEFKKMMMKAGTRFLPVS